MRLDLRGKWWPLVAICIGNLMLLVDVTVVVTAMPEIAQGLDAGLADQQWVLDAYALTLASLLLAIGVAGDRYGHRRVYVLGLAGFAVSSLACGLAPSTGVLIAARAVQGVAGAAMFATNAALLSVVYSGRDRGVAFGIWGAIAGVASALGVTLGGVLTEYVDWRAIFLINPPISLLAILLTWGTITAGAGAVSVAAAAEGRRVDWRGAVLFTACAGALVYAIIRGGEEGWGDDLVLASLAAAVAALAAFLASCVQRGGESALLDLRLMRRPSFAALMAAALIFTGAAFSHFSYTMLWLQDWLGLSPVRAGLALLPVAGTAFAVAAFSGRWVNRLPPRVPVAGGLLLVGVGLLLLTAIGPGSGWTVLVPGLVVSGVGVGLIAPVLVLAALRAAPPERAGMASGAVNTFRQLGFALGVAVLGTLFTSSSHAAGPAGYADGLDDLYLASGIAALAMAAAVALLVRTPRPGRQQPGGEAAAREEPTPAATGPGPGPLRSQTRAN